MTPSIDNSGCAHRLCSVISCFRICALVLALSWVPITEHCALEEFGLLAAGDGCGDHDGALGGTDEACELDACNEIEDGQYKPSFVGSKVVAPHLRVSIEFFAASLFDLDSPDESVLLDELVDRARDWQPEWHFVRRATGSPRAPSLKA